MMITKFVILYLLYGNAPPVEVGLRFQTMDECQAAFDGAYMKKGGDAGWVRPGAEGPIGMCVPITVGRP